MNNTAALPGSAGEQLTNEEFSDFVSWHFSFVIEA